MRAGGDCEEIASLAPSPLDAHRLELLSPLPLSPIDDDGEFPPRGDRLAQGLSQTRLVPRDDQLVRGWLVLRRRAEGVRGHGNPFPSAGPGAGDGQWIS
jgi:hypothetical protein